jgi:hypothetical protein
VAALRCGPQILAAARAQSTSTNATNGPEENLSMTVTKPAISWAALQSLDNHCIGFLCCLSLNKAGTFTPHIKGNLS